MQRSETVAKAVKVISPFTIINRVLTGVESRFPVPLARVLTRLLVRLLGPQRELAVRLRVSTGPAQHRRRVRKRMSAVSGGRSQCQLGLSRLSRVGLAVYRFSLQVRVSHEQSERAVRTHLCTRTDRGHLTRTSG